MTGAEFKAIVNYAGENNILSIGFDNSAVITFDDEFCFTLERNYIEPIECLAFVQFDMKGNPYHTYKHVENIQSIIVREDGIPFSQYDRVNLRG